MAKYDKLTCLIADDYSKARRIIKNILNELGFSCLEAEDGEQALAIILSTQLNLVLACLLYTSPSPRDGLLSRMPSSA